MTTVVKAEQRHEDGETELAMKRKKDRIMQKEKQQQHIKGKLMTEGGPEWLVKVPG